MMRWRSLLLVTLLAGLPMRAEPKERAALPPPMAQPQDLSIFRGRSVEIQLRAQGRIPGQLKFIIRARPSSGRLSEIRTTGRKSATVTYTHDGTPTSSDLFTFAVQAIDSPVSAPASISINISEEPPILSTAHSLDFGTVLLGETREEQITLRNGGGGVLEGRLDAPQAWKILGAAEYRLKRNEEKRVRILFAPEAEQQYSGKLAFSHDARSKVELSGSGISPFEFNPSREIELTVGDGNVLRSGNLVIRNRTPRDRIVAVNVPPEIASPEQVSLAPGEGKTIALHTKAEFLGALEGFVRVESEGFRQSIPMRVFALPPLLRIEPRESVEFGDIEAGKRHKRVLRIKNAGGTSARLHATAPAGILLVPDPNTAVLQPGEMRLFEVVLETSSIGEYRSRVVIKAGAGEPAAVEIAWRILPQRQEAKKIPVSALNPPGSPPALRPAGPQESPNALPPITEIKVLKASNRLFEIGWEKPSPEAKGWVIQQMQFQMASGESPKLVWKDLHNIKFLEENGMAVARFQNLAQGQVWLLRILSIDNEGRRSAPSPTIRLSSAPPPRPFMPWWVAGLLLAGAAAWGAAKLRERRQAEASQESDRIARIER
jgi:hypothetical protein